MSDKKEIISASPKVRKLAREFGANIYEIKGSQREGTIIAASDYMRSYADQIRPYISKSFYSFGTDGYGRSDGRKKLRKFFEIDKEHIVTYTLSALAKDQLISSKYAEKAMKKYNINKDKPIPTEL